MNYKFYVINQKKLISLLVTIIGLLFSILPIKFDTGFNVFVPGILLLVSPIIYLLIWDSNFIEPKNEKYLLSLIMLTILFNHYIFALKFNYPIGTDAPYTLRATNYFLSNSFINFTRISSVSYGFPGLYILYTTLTNITGIDLYILATYIHPSLNMLLFFYLYLFIRRFFDPKLSLIAVFISGWEFTVFQFGFEYRTQSLAVVVYLLILLLIVIDSESNKLKDYNMSTVKKTVSECEHPNNHMMIKLIILILVTSIIISHFVTSIVFLITILTIYFSCFISKKMNWVSNMNVSVSLLILCFILFIFYMLYIGHSFDNLIGFSVNLIKESFFSEACGSSDSTVQSKTEGLHAFLYGPFVFLSTWFTRVLFLGSSFIYIKEVFKYRKKSSDLFVIGWAGVLILFILLISIKGFELNPGRLYNFFAFPFSIILSFGLISVMNLKNIKTKIPLKIIVSLFLVIFVITSLLKLPHSIIGNTEPFRNNETVDYSRWDTNVPIKEKYNISHKDLIGISGENKLISYKYSLHQNDT